LASSVLAKSLTTMGGMTSVRRLRAVFVSTSCVPWPGIRCAARRIRMTPGVQVDVTPLESKRLDLSETEREGD
jgi:hypothetical protein